MRACVCASAHELTLRAALTELLAEVLRSDTRTRRVTWLPGVVTRLVVVHVVGRAVWGEGDRTKSGEN